MKTLNHLTRKKKIWTRFTNVMVILSAFSSPFFAHAEGKKKNSVDLSILSSLSGYKSGSSNKGTIGGILGLSLALSDLNKALSSKVSFGKTLDATTIGELVVRWNGQKFHASGSIVALPYSAEVNLRFDIVLMQWPSGEISLILNPVDIQFNRTLNNLYDYAVGMGAEIIQNIDNKLELKFSTESAFALVYDTQKNIEETGKNYLVRSILSGIFQASGLIDIYGNIRADYFTTKFLYQNGQIPTLAYSDLTTIFGIKIKF